MHASRSKSIVHFSIVFALLASLLGRAIGVTPAYAAMLALGIRLEQLQRDPQWQAPRYPSLGCAMLRQSI